MQLDDYLRVLVKRWYVPVILIAMAVAGAWLYNSVSATRTADGTLAVPLRSFTQFDTIVNSRALAERIATRLDDGTTPDQVDGQIAGGFATQGSRILPLYAVSATDTDGERAALIANLAMDEALVLFRENRQANLDYIQASFRQQLDEADAAAIDAQAEFDRFVAESNAFGLPLKIAQQVDLVSNLRLQLQFGSDSFFESVEPTQAEEELAQARAELSRLLALEPEYNRLQLDARLAEGDIATLEAELRSLEIRGAGFEEAIAAVEAELADAQDRLAAAESDLTSFEAANSAADLPAAIRAEQARVNDLLILQVSGGIIEPGQTLAMAEVELERLQSLQPEYNRLVRSLEQANRLLDVREQQQLFIIQQTLPVDEQVEVVERAALRSVVWWTAIRFAVAIFVAVFLALVLVYLLSFFERVPPTTEEFERILGRPVIGRIPSTAAREARR